MTAGAALLVSLVVAPLGAAVPVATTATATYNSAGGHTFTVPVGVTSVTVTAVGARGGSCSDVGPGGNGGQGATLTGTVPVSPGDVLFVGVGGSGGDCKFLANNGSGPGLPGAGGGGAGGTGGSVGLPGPGGAAGGGASMVGVGSASPRTRC